MTGKPRRAVPADAQLLRVIDAAVSDYPWSVAQYETACTPVDLATVDKAVVRESALVLEHGNRLSAFVVYSGVLEEGSIHNIAVLPDAQRQGYARELILEVLDLFRVQGMLRCLIEVRVSNRAAIALYQNFDFQVDGLRKAYYRSTSGREDALLMSLGLNGNSAK